MESPIVPPAPRLSTVLKASAVALYEHAWRFMLGNLLLGIGLVVVVLVISAMPVGLLLLVLLAAPAAGLMRMAVERARNRPVSLAAFAEPMRRHPWRIFGLALAELLLALVLTLDLVIGLGTVNLLGALLSVLAFYALLTLWAFSLIAWPLLVDPLREDVSTGAVLRLAGGLLLAQPLRIGLLAAVVGLVVVASMLTIAVLVTLGLAFAWLVAAHYALPAADRLEGRATLEAGD